MFRSALLSLLVALVVALVAADPTPRFLGIAPDGDAGDLGAFDRSSVPGATYVAPIAVCDAQSRDARGHQPAREPIVSVHRAAPRPSNVRVASPIEPPPPTPPTPLRC